MHPQLERNLAWLLDTDSTLAAQVLDEVEHGLETPESLSDVSAADRDRAQLVASETAPNRTAVVLGLEPWVFALMSLKTRFICVEPSVRRFVAFAQRFDFSSLQPTGQLLVGEPVARTVVAIGRSGRINIVRGGRHEAEEEAYFDAILSALMTRSQDAAAVRARNQREVLLAKVGASSPLGNLLLGVPAGTLVTGEQLEAQVAKGGTWGRIERLVVAMNSLR